MFCKNIHLMTFRSGLNILIYYLNNSIPENKVGKIEKILETSYNISTITKIEVLGWHKITPDIKNKIEIFLNEASIIYIDKNIENKAIEIKQLFKVAVPDAIIAATAIERNMTIVTRNENDFDKIKEIKIYNPFKY